MYKKYETKDYIEVLEKCSINIRNILMHRFTELEEMREAINDYYPYEDLELKCAEVDYEEKLIKVILEQIEEKTLKFRSEITNGVK